MHRSLSGNKESFKNYVRAVEKMSMIPKIYNNLKGADHKCYVGIRKSDIEYSNEYFTHSACIFSSGKAIFPTRINQNLPCKELFPYMKKR